MRTSRLLLCYMLMCSSLPVSCSVQKRTHRAQDLHAAVNLATFPMPAFRRSQIRGRPRCTSECWRCWDATAHAGDQWRMPHGHARKLAMWRSEEAYLGLSLDGSAMATLSPCACHPKHGTGLHFDAHFRNESFASKRHASCLCCLCTLFADSRCAGSKACQVCQTCSMTATLL